MNSNRSWVGPLECKITDGLLDINGVKGYLQPGDVEILNCLASKMPPGAKILEIGSFLGLSSLIMARALHGSGNFHARLYCVDTWEGSPELQARDEVKEGNMFEVFKGNVAKSGFSNMIVPVKQDSVHASLDFAAQSMDMIYVDGDHSFRGCLSDLVAWYPKLKPGGIFIGHDGEREVRKAIDAFLTEKQELSCILLGVPEYSNYMYQLVERKSLLA